MTTRSGSLAKVLGALAILVALGSWALASPVGASPDEDYHLNSTWCGQGVREGVCESGESSADRRVPAALTQSAECYNFDPQTSASCQGQGFTDDEQQLVLSDRGNFVGDYPPVFYFFTSWFVGDDISVSVIAMRLANALLFVLTVGATYLASAPGLRRALVGGFAITAVPLVMFLIPSINPSAWAVLGVGTVMVAVLGYLTAETRGRRLVLAALAALSVLLAAGARADAAIFSVVAIGAALIMTLRPGVRHLLRMVYPVVLAVVCAVAFLSAGQSEAVSTGDVRPTLSFAVVGDIFMQIPSLWVGSLGQWGLGWLDTTMPSVVWVLSWGVFVALVFAAVAGADRRRGLALAGIVVALWVVPGYIQYLAAAPVGTGVQPRYILPLIVLLAVAALARLEGEAFRITAGQRWVMVVLLSVANAVAMHRNIRRYVTGVDVPSMNLDADIEWWWGIPVSPMVVLVVGASAFAVGLALLTSELTRVSPAAREQVGAGDGAEAGPDRPGTVPRADLAGV
jgi:hypothetical protein